MSAAYRYAQADFRDDPALYMYSAFGGTGFLKAWYQNRTAAIAGLGSDLHEEPECGLPDPESAVDSWTVLAESCAAVAAHRPGDPILRAWLNQLCRRVEARKRIMEGGQSGGEIALDTYAALSVAFARACRQRRDWRWLNVLLKLNDMLVFHRSELEGKAARARLAESLQAERALVRDAAAEQGIGAIDGAAA